MKPRLLLLLVVSLCGCTSTTVTTPQWTVRRISFLQKLEVPNLVIGTNGTVTLQGYSNDGGLSALSKVTEAAVSAAVKSLKP